MARVGRKRKRRVKKLSPKSQLARSNALEVLSLMRTKGHSLAQAARLAETTPRTVLKYAKSALSFTEGGRYRAKPSDRIPRSLRFPTADGLIAVTVRSSKTASKIGQYWAAVDHYLRTGDTEGLAQFRDKSIRTGNVTFEFITDPRTLKRIASAGEIAFEDIYAFTS